MKNATSFNFIAILTLIFFSSSNIYSQHLLNKPNVAVIGLDGVGTNQDAKALGSLARMQLSKLNLYQVMDIYDVEYLLNQTDFDPYNCFGKICMVELGNILKVDKMLTGSVESVDEIIVFTLNLIDVKSSSIEKTVVMEFVNVKNQMSKMMEITVKNMFDITTDMDEVQKLTKPNDFESSVNYPESATLNLSGPRLGFTALSGNLSSIYQAPLTSGGFDATPLFFQFGYQFEVKYLNEGDFQALFEFIPIVSGLDQGRFIPSVSVLNGLRSNKTGWEFAFGPIFYLLRESEGFYDDNNEWRLEREYDGDVPNPAPIVSRLDSRGELAFDSGFLFAVGKTIKSGRLNIPINAFVVPGKSGSRFGISMGFNARRYN